MKKTILFTALVLATGALFAQKKTTTSATVSFDASTPLDKLPKADNKTVVAALDTKAGTLKFEVVVNNFTFANPMMQEHFNSDAWMDSKKFPSATFDGKFIVPTKIDWLKDGTYGAEVFGKLTIHGVTREIKTKASVVVEGKSVTAKADIPVALEDYKVNGPAIAAGKVAKEAKVSIVAVFN